MFCFSELDDGAAIRSDLWEDRARLQEKLELAGKGGDVAWRHALEGLEARITHIEGRFAGLQSIAPETLTALQPEYDEISCSVMEMEVALNEMLPESEIYAPL